LEAAGHVNAEHAVYDPEFAVEVFSDLGVGDSTALWFVQKRPDGYALIDYEEAHSKELTYYYDLLNGKPYRYHCWWLPHDAKARTLQTGKSTIELVMLYDQANPFRRFDRGSNDKFIRLCPKLEIQDGINAVRSVLPTCWFSAKAIYGVEALRAYKREYDDELKVFREKPNHDWSSHGCDAFRYFALSVKAIALSEKRESNIIDFQAPKIQLMPMFEERERRLNMRRGRIE
jgi:hypothetical protein